MWSLPRPSVLLSLRLRPARPARRQRADGTRSEPRGGGGGLCCPAPPPVSATCTCPGLPKNQSRYLIRVVSTSADTPGGGSRGWGGVHVSDQKHHVGHVGVAWAPTTPPVPILSPRAWPFAPPIDILYLKSCVTRFGQVCLPRSMLWATLWRVGTVFRRKHGGKRKRAHRTIARAFLLGRILGGSLVYSI